jgi:Leucine-rich repeat (LRR) protein
LKIYECGLRTIELGAFSGLTKLTDLVLWRNEISEIVPGTFENMNSMEWLVLGRNRLEHLDSDVFSGLVNIKDIDLSGDILQYLLPDTFLRFPNLQRLYIISNPTLQIPTERNFIISHSLTHLFISHCNKSSLSVETFANVSALELFDLNYNSLRTVDINILTALPKLSTLYLDGNLLQCDCQLKEVWRWCEDRNTWTENVQCDTPSEVQSMWWGC